MTTYTDGVGGDVTTAKDTKVNASVPTRNFGVATTILGGTGDKLLIEFDLSAIDADATCDNATLYLYQAGQAAANAFTLTVYSIASGNAAWIEGTKNNATAGAGEPCWDALAADGSGGVTTAWAGAAGLATSGTDYEATALGTINGNRSDANGTEYAIALTATRVKGWFGASNTNYGLLVITSSGNGALASSDHATSGYRPKLVVNYTDAATGATGTLVATLGAATLSGAGAVAIAATLAATLEAATLTGAGGVQVQGAAAINLEAATLTGIGTVQVQGTAAITLGAATLIGTGVVTDVGTATGTLTATLGAATLAGTGTVAIAGSLDATLGAATLAGAGAVGVLGSAAITLADATLAGTGTVTEAGAARGTLVVTLAAATLSGTGTVAIAGAAAITLADATLSGSAGVAVYGTATIILAAALLAGVGIVRSPGQGPGNRSVYRVGVRQGIEVNERDTWDVNERVTHGY